MLPLPHNIPILVILYQSFFHCRQRHPIPRHYATVGICKFVFWRHIDGVRAFAFCWPSAIVMVVVPDHLTLVKRHVSLAVNSGERVAIERCALCGQLGVGAEESLDMSSILEDLTFHGLSPVVSLYKMVELR